MRSKTIRLESKSDSIRQDEASVVGGPRPYLRIGNGSGRYLASEGRARQLLALGKALLEAADVLDALAAEPRKEGE